MRFESLTSLSGNPALVREELLRPGLRFSPDVEHEFTAYLRRSQRMSAIVLAAVGFVILSVFALLDLQRFRLLDPSAPVTWPFYLGVLLPRWLCLVGLLVSIIVVYLGRFPRATGAIIQGTYLLVGLTVFLTTATYGALGLPHATSSYVLVIVAVFLPCGLLFRESFVLGAVLCVCALAMVYRMLYVDHMEQAWLFMVILVMAFAMSSVSAYMRERAQREQYLLRKLLDWDADHDALTGLLNRRAFTEAAEHLLQQARQTDKPIALAIIDVDFFKAYNDHYGHPAGDQALLRVSRQLRECAGNAGDLLVRLGGEEFGLLRMGVDAQTLAQSMRLCQQDLSAASVLHEKSPVAPHLTFSVGVAEARQRDETLSNLYWRADVALYLAKNRGRNRVMGDVATELAP